MRSALIACALWALVAGCEACASEPVIATRAMSLHASTPTGTRVAGVRVWADGVALGETDSAGALRATLRAAHGDAVAVTWACPAGHRASDERRDVALDGAERVPLALKVECEPLEHMAALVVRVRGAPPDGLPIRARDELVGRTDPEGLAHVLLRVRPGSAIAVALDTSAHPQLVPQHPVETFQIGAEDSVLLLDREVSHKPREVKRARSPRARAEPTRPYRIR